MVTAVTQAAVASPQCAHIWLIDTPDGATSVGHCVRCNSRREFYNSIPEDKRINNSDIFTGRRGGSRQTWNEDDADSAVRSMYRR
ncbi:MAG: hypothetical protein OXI41_13160 [Chloroflexota bacterium]|nr:hypothetical protein [Chloroflexota bacterium]MDE2895937.1 hypothetical protein [Chloroflexota bacterium]